MFLLNETHLEIDLQNNSYKFSLSSELWNFLKKIIFPKRIVVEYDRFCEMANNYEIVLRGNSIQMTKNANLECKHGTVVVRLIEWNSNEERAYGRMRESSKNVVNNRKCVNLFTYRNRNRAAINRIKDL